MENSHMSSMKRILFMYLSVGFIAAVCFPFYAYFFVEWKPGKLIYFVIGCFVAGAFVGASNYIIFKKLIRKFIESFSEKSRARIEQTDVGEHDEVGLLAHTFMDMAMKLKSSHEQLEQYSRTLELRVEKRTKELQETLTELKQSQDHLIQSEKMAALGQLVAGVAHEINTPIGIALTMSSCLEEETKKITAFFGDRTLNKDKLATYLSDTYNSCNLVTNNLLRAVQLIRSFKTVSADQTSWDKRPFNLNSYLNDIVTSLMPALRKTPHKVTINCPEDMMIYSNPGVFAQIYTNLILNSLSHAYSKGDEGNISIDVSIAGENLVLLYSDDGKGIPEANMKKVFDPFFTTKRGQGGTGLGLNVVYNLVDQTLKGLIECESVEGHGVVFTITVPVSCIMGE